MPKVVEKGGMTVRVLVRDEHPPAHVHVTHADWQIKVLIGDRAQYWATKFGTPTALDVRRALDLVQDHLSECHAVWRAYHG